MNTHETPGAGRRAARRYADEPSADGALLARLKEWPGREPVRDLAPGVLARLRAAPAPVRRRSTGCGEPPLVPPGSGVIWRRSPEACC